MSTDTPEDKPVEETPEAVEEAAPETAEAPAEEPAAPPAEDAEAPAEEAEAPVAEEAASTAAESLEIGSTATAVAEGDEAETDFEPVVRGKIDKFGVAMGTGRRKTAVARVRVNKGSGKLTINGKELAEYFPVERDRNQILEVLEKTETAGKVDVWARVDGGGITGQSGAVLLGLARALHVMDSSLHHILSENGFLTRDPRMVERKKYGLKKARRSFQFSKR